ncbi:HigA family addiction module antitoxin [Leptolyngbya sp. NIES-2104]|uniref:HigA family addiction module antitoxin n=1 Tax=Leptolyngbya sp. NIES-2104 TaxID=1552121 RepID=UPI00073E40AA|nr:HigA family addiction module antitoxin [Leptolyngbya sp. NIES-2104]
MIRVPTHRVPTHPGEMLQEEFLLPANLTIHELSAAIYVSEEEIQTLVQEQRALTPGLALRLAKYFGTSADFWMNLQLRWDFYHAQNAEAAILSNIQPRSA